MQPQGQIFSLLTGYHKSTWRKVYRGYLNWRRVMRKPAFRICKNKGAGQLHGNHAADQRLCFRYVDSTIPLLPKSKI